MGTHIGTSGNDTLSGGPDGFDVAEGTYDGGNYIFGRAGDDVIFGDHGVDALYGEQGHDTIHGRGSDDWLIGGDGNDALLGDAGNDDLLGGRGHDVMSGGSGQDTFRFATMQDFESPTAGCDVITDFASAEGDRIDITALRGAVESPDSEFAFIGKFEFVGQGPFTGEAQVRCEYDQDLGGCMVYGNTDRDAAPDFAILVQGVTSLSASDFLL